jgi:hypothetical protein
MGCLFLLEVRQQKAKLYLMNKFDLSRLLEREKAYFLVLEGHIAIEEFNS